MSTPACICSTYISLTLRSAPGGALSAQTCAHNVIQYDGFGKRPVRRRSVAIGAAEEAQRQPVLVVPRHGGRKIVLVPGLDRSQQLIVDVDVARVDGHR